MRFRLEVVISVATYRLSLQQILNSHPANKLAADLDGTTLVSAFSDTRTTAIAKVAYALGAAEWKLFIAHRAPQKAPIGEKPTDGVGARFRYDDIDTLIPNPVYQRCKRMLDTLAVLVASPALVLIALVTALLIKMDDGGAIFFIQHRVGFRGRVFRILKFRTMRADISPRLAYTERNDARITGIGRVLRRFRIDELPQVINILRGEMSWIGPRPESLALSKWYRSQIPFYSDRHIVRPGISGLAQVQQGWAAQLKDVEKKLSYDLYYIKNFSPWLDAFVVSRTVRAIATGFGAR